MYIHLLTISELPGTSKEVFPTAFLHGLWAIYYSLVPRNAGRLMGIADTLAEQGYRVLLSDPFYGDTAAGKEDIMVPRFLF